MSLQLVPIPSHYSADIGYKVLRPLRPYLESLALVPGITAAQGKQMFVTLERIIEGIQQAYDSGELDGDLTWKNLAADTLSQLDGFLNVVSPLMVAYSNKAGNLVAQRAVDVANGAQLPLLTSDEALAEIVMSDADINTILSEVNLLLGV